MVNISIMSIESIEKYLEQRKKEESDFFEDISVNNDGDVAVYCYSKIIAGSFSEDNVKDDGEIFYLLDPNLPEGYIFKIVPCGVGKGQVVAIVKED